MLATQTRGPLRELAHLTPGRKRGPIARLVSPSDLGEVIKPFVFLDHAVFSDRDAPMDKNLLWHPHSGIATVTVVLEGSIEYAETTGKSGVVQTSRGATLQIADSTPATALAEAVPEKAATTGVSA